MWGFLNKYILGGETMVGIILASHGEFAAGIKQSGEMIFGEQDKVEVVTFKNGESPDDLKQHLLDATTKFDPEDDVLFLIDLWGGSPFNQASGIFEEHKDKWAIVTGLNLPMLIEAYGSRLTMNSAHELAAHLVAAGRDGVKVKPEALEPKPKAAPAAKKHAAALPEGTVVGDGKIKLVLARVDSRLLHGQVATTWTKTTGPNRIIVVSDGVAKDKLRKTMIVEAAPPGVKANVVPIKKFIDVCKDPRFGNTKALILFETPEDALEVVNAGVDIPTLNIGSMAHSEGKTVINKVLSVDQKDVDAFKALRDKGVKFDVRKVPADSPENLGNLLKKAGFDF
ncbi:pts system, mannose-specific iiab component [Lacticaseibacillus thailandensis DSM 22698 = JCM 13996]|uniref:PTS system mannose-specific EIIAB component n=2 Tax=Lacticaseibacillus thailandensis TaxID=381741 RepID=A0A0R2CGR7_9LACO|nr:pts system, mannose-specific iiab component [Lacticaseibacillus thailandensis DSM 22698 = JCM 13996]